MVVGLLVEVGQSDTRVSQLTHGFPVSPNPLFLSDAFPIENRAGLNSQSIEALCRQLAQVLPEGATADSLDTTEGSRVEKVLSDWHLIYFAAGSGVFSEVSQVDLAGLQRLIITPTSRTRSGSLLKLLLSMSGRTSRR